MLDNIFRNMTDVVKNLLLLNIVMYVLTLSFPHLYDTLALHNFMSDKFEPYQMVSHIFMHSIDGNYALTHILFNMFALVMFGTALERVWGPKRFLFFYFFSAVGAFLLQMGINQWQYMQVFGDMTEDQIIQITKEAKDLFENGKYSPLLDQEGFNVLVKYGKYHYGNMVGASGAIMGLLAAFAFLFPNTELMLIFLPIPIKAKYFVPFYMLVELFLGVGNFQWDNIAHYAHLGGALFGFILVYIWQRDKNRMY